jgi:hypothetical protein
MCLIDPTAARIIARSMEGTMSNHDQENRQQASKRVVSVLHPAVYVALIGLTAWLVLAIWGFGYDGQTDYLLAIVTGFLVIAVAIPSILALMVHRQSHSDVPKSSAKTSLREWMAGDFDTWQDRVKGRNAAVEILLPMAAIAIGMTAFAIVLYFTEAGT